MSRQIDNYVASMEFDNSKFEKNVSTTMSTLDKLKQKLNLNGASKGLEDINAAAGKVNMSGLGSGVDAVKAKFSALDVVAVTALANITNSAVNAAKNMVSTLTIAPISDGFKEYEMTLNAVQTTMAGTGKTAEEVEKELKKLDEYADKTIYSSADMFNNLPKFTNAGVELETATKAMIGIANATALAGGDANKASIAFYNLGQSIGTGYLTRMDYNSINNAGIATMEWKNAMVEAAIAQGTLTKTGEDAYKAGNKTFTLQQLFIDGLQEQWATADVLIDVFGDYGDQTTEIGKKAWSAAQDVKTFTMMMESLQATAGTGWKDTWQIIFGGLDEAKEFWTGLNNVISGIIEKMADWRNGILEGALGKSFKTLMKPLDGLKKTINTISEPIKTVTKTLEDYNNVVDEVIRGEWGHVQKRWDALTEAGYDWITVQNMVNEKLGVSKRRQTDYVIGQETVAKSTEKTTEANSEYIAKLAEMSEAELEALGLTKEQIAAIKEIKVQADKLGLSVEDFINNIDEIDGRWVLINIFKNAWAGLIKVFEAVKAAWQEVFPPKTIEERSQQLYDIIAAIHKFSTKLIISDETAGKLTKTFKGLFAVLDIVRTLLGGGIKIALKIITKILSYFHLDILDVTAAIGDALVKFHEWFESITDISGILDAVVPLIEKVADATREWFKSFKESKGIQNTIKYIKNLCSGVKEWWASLKDSEDLSKTIAEGIVNAFSSIPKIISTIASNIWDAITGSFSGLNTNPLDGFFKKLTSGLSIAGQTIVELGKILLKKLNGFLTAHGFEEISTDVIAGLVNGLKDGAVNAWNAAVEMAKNLVQKVKDFLGIESPSTVFAAIGGFIIAGLVMGLQNGIPDSLGAIKDVFQPMLDWIGTLDFGSIFAAVLGLGTIGTTYKLSGALENLTAPIKGLEEIFSGVGKVLTTSAKPIAKVIKNTAKVVKSFSKVLNAVAFDIKAEGIKKLGETLLMLVGAIIILTFFEPAELWNAVGLVAALAAVLVGLSLAISKINDSSVDIGKEGLSVKGMSTGLISIAAAILLMAVAVKMIGSLDPDQAKQGFLGLAGIVVAIGIVIVAFGKFVKGKAAENVDKFGTAMTKLAVALLLMAVVVKILGKMDQDTLIQGGVAILAFAGIMVGLMAATKLISGSKNVETIGSTLLKIALAIGVMALVAKALGSMDRNELIQGGIAIAAFGGIMVGLMAATKLINGSKNVDSIGGTLLKIALAIGVMGLVAKLLGGMDPSELIQGGIAIVAFSGIIVGLMAATKLISGSKNVDSIGKTLLAVSGAIAIMALSAFMLSMVSWEGFAKGTIMITAFAAIIVGLMAATKLISGSKNVDSIGKTLLAVSGAIAILAGIAVLLSLVPTENLIKGVAVVAVLAGIIAGLIAVTSLAKNCLGNLIVLTVMIAVLAGAVYLLSTIPAESAITSAVIIGGLMVVMTGVLAALAIIGKSAKDALMGVLALLAMAVPLFAFVAVLVSMQNVQNAMTNVMALTVLATAMTLLLVPLTVIGAFGMTGAPYLGVLALLAMAVPLLAFVGVLALMSGIQNGIANALALAMLMTAIGDVLFKISLVAPLAVVGVAALSAMLGLMTTLGVVATAIGALVTQFPQLQTFLDTGIPILEQLASGLGSIIGSFITGFAGEVMTILPQLGLCLSQFMINATPFIVGAKMIDESVLAGVGILAGAVIALTAADLITGVASFLQGGSSFADLGTQLSQFMINALPFIMTAALITPEMISGVKALAETILIITAADVLQGLTSFITGGSSLETFAAQLPILGQGLAAFSTSLGSFTEEQLATVNCAARAIRTLAQASSEIPNTGGLLGQLVGENDLGVFAAQFPILGLGLAQFLANIGTFSEEQVATVNCAAQAIKSLAEASSEIPNSGGWLGQIVGENDLGTFADQFPSLGTGLRGFLDNVGTFTDEQVATVDCAAQAIKTLASAASEIPNSGGWVGAIVGENDLGTFADQFPSLGTGLRGFLDNVGTFTEEQVATVNCAANAVKTLASVASTIPNEGGWISKIVGDNNLGTFASNFPELGKGLSGFVSNLGTFTSAQVATVDAAIQAIKALSTLANADLKGATKHLSDFGKDLPDFAKKLGSFCTNMPSKESTSAAVSNLENILSAVDSISNANSGSLATFADNLKKVGKNAVDKFVDAFTSSSAKTDLKNAAKKLADQVVDGIEAKEKAIKSAAKDAAEKAVDGVETQKDEMKSAGKDLGSGLVNGIKAKWDAAYDAGYTLGQKAVQGEKDGQASNSPSKLTTQAGKWLGEGLIIGLKSMGKSVYNASENMGQEATNGVSSAMTSILDALSSDMDAQPTIRPVIDLSDVKTGVNAIGGLFAGTQSIGVQSNLNAINLTMNRKLQNGTNNDIISAINKLNDGLEGNRGDTYNFAGITYDNGNEISDAVQTLVRAAKMGRRV